MSHPASRRRACLARFAASICVLLCFAVAPARGAEVPSSSLGFVVLDADRAAALPVVRDAGAGPGPVALLVADWAVIERRPGVYAWDALDRARDTARARGYRIALRVEGTHALHVPGGALPSPLVPGSLEPWVTFVRAAVRRIGAPLELVQIGRTVGDDPRGGGYDPTTYGFVLKQTALAARAEAEAAGVPLRVAQAAVSGEHLAWQRQLWERESAAYIDVLPVRVAAQADPAAVRQAVDAVRQESLRHPPAAEVWAVVEDRAAAAPWDAVSTAVATLGAGVAVALVDAPPAGGGTEPAGWAAGLHAVLAGGFAAGPSGALRLEDEAGNAWPAGSVLGRFVQGTTLSTLIVYRAPGESGQDAVRLVLDTGFVRNARTLDPATGRERRVRSDAAGEGRTLVAPAGVAPVLALFDRPAAAAGFELPLEELGVASTRSLTAEEIIARHQQVAQSQEDRLERWMATARMELNYRIDQAGSTVDLSIDANYFWERGGAAEWEQTGYYINGTRINWKNIPELPLIQPDKVITLPLDLTLDKTYRYRLVGEDRVEGRPAWVLEFSPAAADAPLSLYRGRVWIDREDFRRLKTSVVQTNMTSPVLSNEEVDRFGDYPGPGGDRFRLLSRIDGQQTWSLFSRTFVVRRKFTFLDYTINPPADEFASRRAQAYASSNQMLRDTEQGVRYLERTDDGARVVRDTYNTGQLFAGGGAFSDGSTDGVQPLGGVNYVNVDVGGRNIQVNAFFAGVLGFFTASKPDLFGSRWDATADASLAALAFADNIFRGSEDDIEQERIDIRNQTLSLRVGRPLGRYWKFSFSAGVRVREFSQNDEAKDARQAYNTLNGADLDFELPTDHLELRGSLLVEYNHRGWSLRGRYARAHRSDWKEWGLVDRTSGSFGSIDPLTQTFIPGPPEPVLDDFSRWGVTGFREWLLPRFQKIRGEVNYLDGDDLDRFSRYEFNLFGTDRLDGFAGSGVRFDDGTIARAGYSFNLFEAVRFDAALSRASVEDLSSGRGRESFLGAGLSGSFVGPWKTYFTVSYGRALASDLKDLEGQDEFLVLVLKLF